VTNPAAAAAADVTLLAIDMGPGTFTRRLVEHAVSHPEVAIRFEGPYGHMRVQPQHYPVVILVGGGIGNCIIPGSGSRFAGIAHLGTSCNCILIIMLLRHLQV